MYQPDTMKKAILSEVSVPARGAPMDKSPILCSAQQYHVSRTILPATLKSLPPSLFMTLTFETGKCSTDFEQSWKV